MKALLCILLLTASSMTHAVDCYSSFMDEHGIVDSKAFSFFNEFSVGLGEDPKAFVEEVIERVLPKNGSCAHILSKSTNSEGIKINCSEIVPGKWHSQSCFAESSLGYFFINLDMMDTVHLIFNRWD